MPTAIRVPLFDTWQPGYGGSMVEVRVAGTTALADIFTDEALSIAAPNPQVLDRMMIEGVSYGKFKVPVYAGEPFEMVINSTDVTGVIRPPTADLSGADASQALITLEGGSQARESRDWAADIVYAEWHGEIADTAATNTATMLLAIAEVSGRGGGRVILPEGDIPFTTMTLPQNVILEGQGIFSTILQSQLGAASIIFNGAGAGLRRLTLDGIDLTTASLGVESIGHNSTIFDDVLIKRFETGIHFKGGRYGDWENLFISDVTDGAKLHGDLDAGGLGFGDEFSFNKWIGGQIELAVNIGLDLSYEDKPCHTNTFATIRLDANGVAVRVNGARWSDLEGCIWGDDLVNTTNLQVLDDSATQFTDNTVVGLNLNNGSMNGGAATFTDTCESVRFVRMNILGVDFTYTLPDNNILFQDCIEDANVTISGESIRHVRERTMLQGGSAGFTTNNTETEAWSQQMTPGQAGYIEVKVIARERFPGGKSAMWHFGAGVIRPGAELDYDTQTADFTEGDLLTGATSGATAIIQTDVDAGANGTLTLIQITGVFENNEIITDPSGGSAMADGVLSVPEVIFDLQGIRYITAAPPGAWNARLFPNEDQIEVLVTGDTGETVDFIVSVKSVLT